MELNTGFRLLDPLRQAEAVKALLLDSDLTIDAIGQLLGYADRFAFSRQFRKHTGMPPATFRRAHRG